MNSSEGHAAMLHTIFHIEFNAINLPLDAAYRFRGLPDDFNMRLAESSTRRSSLIFIDAGAAAGAW